MRKFCFEGGFAMSSFTELIQIFDDGVEEIEDLPIVRRTIGTEDLVSLALWCHVKE
jgi:hypothetical protein